MEEGERGGKKKLTHRRNFGLEELGREQGVVAEDYMKETVSMRRIESRRIG